jgi:hypothetical protein
LAVVIIMAFQALGWVAFAASAVALLAGSQFIRRGNGWGWLYLALGLALGLSAIGVLRPVVAYSFGA